MNGFNGNGKLYFGDFELDPDRRLLRNRGEVVPLNAKAFELFAVLVENRGRVLSKTQLLDAVWADQFVEENNLTVHIAALRKALGEKKGEHRYIVTVPGKGYEFVGDLNGNGHDGVVVETREIKRIVIEETATGETNFLPAYSKPKNWLWPVLALTGLVIVSMIFLGARYTNPNNANSFELTPVTFPIAAGFPQRVAISKDGKTVVYSRRLKGKDSLWVSDVASKSTVQITEDSSRLHGQLQISPDARTIYFTAKDDNHPQWTLMSVPVFGGPIKELIEGVRGGIAVSPDGTEIAYFRASELGKAQPLYITDAAMLKGERVLYSPQGSETVASVQISWSPISQAVTIAVTDRSLGHCNFINIDRVTGGATILEGVRCDGFKNFAWLADESGIAVMESSDTESGRSQIAVVGVPSGKRLHGTHEGPLIPYSLTASDSGHLAVLEGRNFPGIFIASGASAPSSVLVGAGRGEGAYGVVRAPDGKLLYTLNIEKSRSISEMNPDGQGSRELIAHESEKDDVQINVTPDNRYIVFESDRSGSSQIWRANRDGTQLTMLTRDGEASFEPVLTRDGAAVLYTSKRDGQYTIWRIGLDGGEPKKLSADNCTWPDVSPDGTRFVCAASTTADGGTRQLAIYNIDGGKPLHLFKMAVSHAVFNRVRWSPDGRSVVYKDIAEGLWKQNLSGGKPEKVAGFEDVRVFHFNYMPDGAMLYSGGPQMREIVILEPRSK